ncbi:DUF262 domain-containing protein [Chitinophaga agri]|uniref:DUF262 domain-containing protein n=1 Tax=Chitinophaga agri TaxID=2703787 RepID=A0A6B9Z951_9BACT|nr:DUF262 domain-containing protein [Chitinophaga agri]QHS58778.1 DUF262 domain-containing protein [Chitinophaga agri]
MAVTKLILKPVCQLRGERFYVPAYQRGYRWTQMQVLALLEDIWKFRIDNHNSQREVFYCLQPLVVAQSPQGWIVIDGQQRLTTIQLIIIYLRTLTEDPEYFKFVLSYETRPESQRFVENLHTMEHADNIDYHYMIEAYHAIDTWFKGKGPNAKINFQQTLLNDDEDGKNVKVIWYEVEHAETANHIDIFTRLNIGKIALTNAELIKAYLLQKTHFSPEKANLKQIQIASEWDYIEKMLQRDDFWYFIYDSSDSSAYENRIEYLFDRMFDRKPEHDHYYTFYSFINERNLIKDQNNNVDVGAMWIRVKNYFQVFEEWFNNNDLYHLIGYLICCEYRIDALKQTADNQTKDSFVQILNQKIQDTVNFYIEDLEYGADNDKIKKVLLLFNIRTLMLSKGDSRFPFNLYKMNRWDIEHISSQTEKDIDKRYRKEWMADIITYFSGQSIDTIVENEQPESVLFIGLNDRDRSICERLFKLYTKETVNDREFDNVKNEIAERFKEGVKATNKYMDNIGNLALLDSNTNRGYKNAFFPIKRQRIIENDSIGKFVPICTKNVFLKYYSDQLGDVMHWKESDAISYTHSINRILEKYLPQKKNNVPCN